MNRADLPIASRRRLADAMALVVLAITLWVGLVPFHPWDLARSPTDRPPLDSTVTDVALPDFVANILLYMPLGLAGAACLIRRGWRGSAAIMGTVLFATATSMFIELAQTRIAIRVSSLLDVLANMSGAVIGAAMASAVQAARPRVATAIMFEIRQRPFAAVATAYALVLVLLAAVPFSFSFDAGRWKTAMQSANFVPFAPLTRGPTANAVSTATAGIAATGSSPRVVRVYDTTIDALPIDDLESSQRLIDAKSWESWKCWSRWATECALFAVLAWLMGAALIGEYHFGRASAMVLVWWLGSLLAITLSVLQFPMVTRPFDITDLLFRIAGVVVGWYTCPRWLLKPEVSGSPPRRTRAMAETLWVASTLVLIHIVYEGLIPWAFRWNPRQVFEALASPAVLPLYSYSLARFDLMLVDLTQKFGQYALFGALLAVGVPRYHRLRWRAITVEIAGICCAIALLIEIVQIAIPVRTPSLTEPLVSLAASASGVTLLRRAAGLRRRALSLGLDPAQKAAELLPAPRPAWSPLDHLIAGLTDPRDDAPVERPSRPVPSSGRNVL